MRGKNKLSGILLTFAAVVLQSTIFSDFAFRGVKADIALIIIVLTANYTGNITGQLTGFFAGLAEDFLSISPLGFNALIKSIIGYLSGKTEGKIFLDPIVTPIILVLIGTILKYFISFVLLVIFIPEQQDAVFSFDFIIEIGLNIVVTPFVYLILKIVRILPQQNNSRMP